MILLGTTLGYLGFLLGYEWWALATHNATITDHVRDVIRTWGMLGPLVGLIVGGLLVHFWWT